MPRCYPHFAAFFQLRVCIQLPPARIEEHNRVEVALEPKMDDVVRCAKESLQTFLLPLALDIIYGNSCSHDVGTKLGDS